MNLLLLEIDVHPDLWLVGYVGEGATANIPSGIWGIKCFRSNTTDTNWRTSYGDGFYGNETVTKVVIPEGTVIIEDSAFCGTLNLVDVTFPDSLKILKNHAFEKCGKNAQTLHYYVLPDDMTEVSTGIWGAFNEINMGRISCDPASETAMLVSNAYTGHYNGSYNFAEKGNEANGLIYCYDRYNTDTPDVYEYHLVLKQFDDTTSEVQIPSGIGVWRIENNVFQNITGLKRISIPAGVVEIGADAFNGCYLLHDGYLDTENVIVIPNTVVRAGNNAFRDLGKFIDERFYLVLPSSLTEFDINIFYGCNAVLVSPQGSAVANALWANWYQYYNTLEDAINQQNIQRQPYIVDGQVVPRDYEGRP